MLVKGAGIGSIVPYSKKGKKPVLNMISKEISYFKPKLEDALQTLLNLKKYLADNNDTITKLHIPFIGAGLDGLSWFTVESFILENFSDLDIEITAFYFSQPELKKIINKGSKHPSAEIYLKTFV